MDGQTDNVLPVLKQVVFCLEWKKNDILLFKFFFFKTDSLIQWCIPILPAYFFL